MRKVVLMHITLATILLAILPVSTAQAQASRVFVSVLGNDANNCSIASPCRTFQVAYNAAAPGGEIDVFEPGGYGPLIISKAISIQGHGFSGVSVGSGATGITINAPSTDAVNLSGLIIEGAKVGLNGIVFNSGKSLTIEDCMVRNLSNDGIDFLSSNASSFTLLNTVVADNGSSGVFVFPSGSGNVKVAVERVELNNNGTGLWVNGNNGSGQIDAMVTDSFAHHNVAQGFLVQVGTGHLQSTLTLSRSVTANNDTGATAFGPNALLRLAQSYIIANISFGWLQSGNGSGNGVVYSFGDNYIEGNPSGNTAPTNVLQRK